MNRSLRTLFFVNSIFILGANLLGPLYAVFVESIGGGVIEASFTWSTFLVSTTLTTFVLYQFGDRIKETEYLLIAGFFLRALAWFSLIFVTTLPQLVIAQIIIGVGEGLGTPAFDVIFAEHLDRGKHIREYSTWKIFSNLLGALAVGAGGVIVSQFGFPALFVLMGVIATLAGIITLVKPRTLL